MAQKKQKKITDLQIVDEVTDSLNFPGDDSIQTYRASALQLKNYMIPKGTMWNYAGDTAPTGWLFCDGSAISRTTYADLFAVIGTTYGVGDGSTTFNLPDSRGRALIGVGTGSGLTARSLADQVGAESVNLQHYHGIQHVHQWYADVGTGGNSASYTSSGNSSAMLGGTKPAEPSKALSTTADASPAYRLSNSYFTSLALEIGGSTSKPNSNIALSSSQSIMQPSLAVNFMIKF